jgi:hypothetical protein
MSRMIENVSKFTETDEPVRYAITGQVGVNPVWRFLSFWLIVTNKPRIIVVAKSLILVLKAGQFRSARTKPKAFLYEVPRATVLGPLKGSWSRVALGSEKVWVSRNTYKVIERANAEIGSPTATPAAG